MKKVSVLLVAVFFLFLLVNTSSEVFAVKTFGQSCDPTDTLPNHDCSTNLVCKVVPGGTATQATCIRSIIQVDSPKQGFATMGNAISNILTLAFAVAVLIVLVMLILGAYEWMVSGGDKEAVGKARTRIINALVGLAVLAIAFALANVFGQFVGLDLKNLTIPAPDPNASGL